MNYRSDRDSKLDIHLNKICIASRHFEMRQLQGQVDSAHLSQSLISMTDGKNGRSNNSSNSLKIGWQERVTLHFLIIPITRSNNTLITFSNLSFSSRDEIRLSQPQTNWQCGAQVVDIMCRERAHDVFTVRIEFRRL